MSRIPQKTVVAVLAAGTGALSVLLVSSLLVANDPELRAAVRRFRTLSPTEAQRLKTTFRSLRADPAEHDRIRNIHQSITVDPDLNQQLEQLYGWWCTRSDAQRADLRELQSRPQLWVEQTRRRYADSSAAGGIELTLPSRPGRGGRDGPPVLNVSREQIDRFLEAALADVDLTTEEHDLRDAVDSADRALVDVLIAARQLFPVQRGGAPLDQNAMHRVYQAATTHLLPDDRRGPPPESWSEMIRTLALLQSIKNHLSGEFLRRHAVSDDTIEQQFEALTSTERMQLMMSDPRQATRTVQAQLKAADQDQAVSRLAEWLAEFDRRATRTFQQLRGRRAGGGRPNDDRPRRDGSRQRDKDRRPFPAGNGRPQRPPGPP